MTLSQMKFMLEIHFSDVVISEKKLVTIDLATMAKESLNEEKRQELMACIKKDAQRDQSNDLQAIYEYLQPQ